MYVLITVNDFTSKGIVQRQPAVVAVSSVRFDSLVRDPKLPCTIGHF
ncbi:hypothetical protein [Arthrobacter sp. NPDC057013]